ncbi:DUF1810 domain-containing protein [Telluria aromaticivorans]|uniref:DUF1810 domain-containing protein n=1 Tax=Telluria aromaticivorans TaxID=2725995 RepID=A0A7Y2NXW0_9BURK|nr:DUF1810 domain-containing protein [Telluria aromaticivorans]NNG22152.1 DUF1810 domain-containing protein [Telluria aromaticivorans]
METEFDLERFVQAQAPVYGTAVAELRAGHKRTHWMWFIFPQIAGLGQSEMARRYALRNGDEAAAYLEHPVLGARLRECAAIVASLDGPTADDIFGHPDTLKFRSSMTLFADVAPDEAVFQACIDKYFDGEPDDETLARL